MKNIPFIEDAFAQEKLLQALLQPLVNEVAEQQLYLKKTDELFTSYLERINRIQSVNSTSKYINETNWLKKELNQQLETEFPKKEEISIFDFYTEFFEVFENLTNNVAKKVTAIQKAQRFSIQPQNTISIQVQKVFKQFFFFIGTFSIRTKNLFQKKKSPIVRWKQTIPLKAMLEHHLKYDLSQKSLRFFNEIQKLKCDARNIKWRINKDINREVAALLDKEDIDFEELKDHLRTMAERKQIQEVIADFDRKLSTWKVDNQQNITESLIQFNESIDLVDTLELHADFYSNTALQTKSNTAQATFKQILNGWRNTQYAQIDDFQIDLELYQLKYSGLTQYFLLENGCKKRVAKTVTEFIDTIKIQLEEVIKKVESAKSPSEIKELLISERIKLHHELKNKSVPLAITALYENNFPNLIERMETKIRAQLSVMKDKRIIYSKETYDAPIPKSNLSHFNPKELVEVDLIGPFSNKLFQLKTALNEKLSSTEIGLNDLVGIVDYNLDAATNSVDGELALDEIKAIAKEGLERACARTGALADDLGGISVIIGVHLKKEIDKLNVGLLGLTNNENITNLRIKLAKAKAIEKTEQYRRELFSKVRNFVPIALRFGQQKWSKLLLYSRAIQERIGIIEPNTELTTALSDFLSHSEKAIQKLPYVYRRLYEIKPLEEDGFFEGRIKESAKLEEAFSHWNESNVSSAVIVGEKGSGASSLLNKFVKSHNDSNITRHKMTTSACTADEFFLFFDTLFEDDELGDFDGTVNFLNKGRKRIIILEDIQHFYLKKSNGFEAINLLLELISQTAKNVFWLVGISTFSWNYFEKTIAIERFIRHKIILSRLNEEQIVKLIMKRHRVSGYNLKFDENQLRRKDLFTLLRKTTDNSQEGLKRTFFTELNSFAQSNISLALLYWLHSVISFENNTVVIGKIKNIKFDFLTSLDATSIFTLHSLLLHDTLSLKEHAEVFSQAEKQSRMTLMVLEDSGILIFRNGEYTINQLIYRQVVTVLRNKNLIH